MHRLQSEEAQEVVRLASERQADGPTIEGLAEALNLPTSEVKRLLADVRARKTTIGAVPERRFGDRSAALSAALVLALVVVVGVVGGGAYLLTHRSASQSEPFVIDDGEGTVVIGPGGITVRDKKGTVTVPEIPKTPSPSSSPELSEREAIESAINSLRQQMGDGSRSSLERQSIRDALKELQDELARKS